MCTYRHMCVRTQLYIQTHTHIHVHMCVLYIYNRIHIYMWLFLDCFHAGGRDKVGGQEGPTFLEHFPKQIPRFLLNTLLLWRPVLAISGVPYLHYFVDFLVYLFFHSKC